MSKNKIYTLSIAVTAVFYLISCGFIFLFSKEIQSREFEEAAARQYEYLKNQIMSANDINEIKYDFSGANRTYPTVYLLIDKEGNVIARSTPAISVYYYDDNKEVVNRIFVDLEKYLTEETQAMLADLTDGFERRLTKLSLCEENGGYIPVKACLLDNRNGTYSETEIVFTDRNPTCEITAAADCIIQLNDFTYSTNKVFNKYYDKLKSNLDSFIADFALTHEWMSAYDRLGGSGLYESGLYQREGYFAIGEKAYCLYFDSRYDMNYDAFRSDTFRFAAEEILFVYWFIKTLLYVIICRIYDKNQRLKKSREAFISAAAHELKTPLAVIANKSECILEDVSPELNKEYVNSIYDESRRMSRMVKTLLRYNKLSADTKTEKKKEKLSPIIAGQFEKYQPLFEAKSITYIRSIDENAVLDCNADMIGLAIDNLLSNAVKFTPDGGEIKITVTAEKRSARFEIYNSGSRIPKEDIPYIWEELFSGDKSRTRSDDSTGMGLAICRLIFEIHGFEYDFINEANGVTFYFSGKK